MENKKEKDIKKQNTPLMFIHTVQTVNDENKEQVYYDSRYPKKKDK